MQPEEILEILSNVNLPNVFNPYIDVCELLDEAGSASIRKNNLLSYMKSINGTVKTIWFARDLGYRGGRRTGLALTDEAHFQSFQQLYTGSVISKATKGPIVIERTASVIWDMLNTIPDRPFLWNIFPFHPHDENNPFSNRCHTLSESKACAHITEAIINWVKPEKIIAIGKDSYKALTKMDINCIYVRHPSFGGQSEFESGMKNIYNL